MQEVWILCQSLTQSQRAKALLAHSGVEAAVLRIPAERTGMGCGYGVKVKKENEAEAKRILSDAGMRVRVIQR